MTKIFTLQVKIVSYTAFYYVFILIKKEEEKNNGKKWFIYFINTSRKEPVSIKILAIFGLSINKKYDWRHEETHWCKRNPFRAELRVIMIIHGKLIEYFLIFSSVVDQRSLTELQGRSSLLQGVYNNILFPSFCMIFISLYEFFIGCFTFS